MGEMIHHGGTSRCLWFWDNDESRKQVETHFVSTCHGFLHTLECMLILFYVVDSRFLKHWKTGENPQMLCLQFLYVLSIVHFSSDVGTPKSSNLTWNFESFTLSPIITEVENYPNWKETYITGTRFALNHDCWRNNTWSTWTSSWMKHKYQATEPLWMYALLELNEMWTFPTWHFSGVGSITVILLTSIFGSRKRSGSLACACAGRVTHSNNWLSAVTCSPKRVRPWFLTYNLC